MLLRGTMNINGSECSYTKHGALFGLMTLTRDHISELTVRSHERAPKSGNDMTSHEIYFWNFCMLQFLWTGDLGLFLCTQCDFEDNEGSYLGFPILNLKLDQLDQVFLSKTKILVFKLTTHWFSVRSHNHYTKELTVSEGSFQKPSVMLDWF